MLENILKNPARFFALLGILLVYGLYCGLKLPVSLYPMTSRPSVNLVVPYGPYSKDEFLDQFGPEIEDRINKIQSSELVIDELIGNYDEGEAFYEINFAWYTSYDQAVKELRNVAASLSSILSKDITDNIHVWQRNRNAGFLAVNIFSKSIPLAQLYEQITPVLNPELAKVTSAEQALVWNPEQYGISINLLPEKMAQYGLFPKDIIVAVEQSLVSLGGSFVKLGEKDQKFEIAKTVATLDSLKNLQISSSEHTILLKNIANISYGKDLTRDRSFKTNGMDSLILWATPKSGANVKEMAEEILRILKSKRRFLPEDLEYNVLVDPSAAIQKSVNNLIVNVVLAATLAVLVLYLFIGSFKNVGAAALEIPSSMILSFIVMKYSGMNLNLISLGGLALAAGMNVDASVVIMENIFKHQEIWKKQKRSVSSFHDRLQLISAAVSEVALPVMLSIATTLIVFIPMAMTSNLTYAILGDLARAVIFSHAISGVIALFVVPSVRMLLLKKNALDVEEAPLERPLRKFEGWYEQILDKSLGRKHAKSFSVLAPILVAVLLTLTLLPHIPKEIIGKPDSDWIYMGINSTESKNGRHMENIMQKHEMEVMAEYGDKIAYTWAEKNSASRGQLMFRLKDRSDMQEVEKGLKDKFPNTPNTYYGIGNWNPAELPLPDVYHFQVVVTGNDPEVTANVGSRIKAFLNEEDSYDRIHTWPRINNSFSFIFNPYPELWKSVTALERVSTRDIVNVSNLTNRAQNIGSIRFQDKMTDIKVLLDDKRYEDPQILSSYPIKVGEKIIPLSALGKFTTVKKSDRSLRKNGQNRAIISATLEKDPKGWEEKYKAITAKIQENLKNIAPEEGVTLEFEDPQVELSSALEQLKTSLVISIALIFLVLWLQFQSVKQVGVIMMTLPLGLAGVILSLYVFDSFLSLNSALGIILLNGITVNNSILLTDVTNKLRERGYRGKELIIQAATRRLRPILITSFTTILGMFPVAIGYGDGGKILQPLGIAVCSGLFIATFFTLVIVPVLLYQKEEELNTSPSDSIGVYKTSVNVSLNEVSL